MGNDTASHKTAQKNECMSNNERVYAEAARGSQSEKCNIDMSKIGGKKQLKTVTNNQLRQHGQSVRVGTYVIANENGGEMRYYHEPGKPWAIKHRPGPIKVNVKGSTN